MIDESVDRLLHAARQVLLFGGVNLSNLADLAEAVEHFDMLSEADTSADQINRTE